VSLFLVKFSYKDMIRFLFVSGNVFIHKLGLKVTAKLENLQQEEVDEYESNTIEELNCLEHPARKKLDQVLATYGLKLESVRRECILFLFRVKPGATSSVFLQKYVTGDIADIFFAFLPNDESTAFPTVLQVRLEVANEDNLYQPQSLKSIAFCRLPCPKSKRRPYTGLQLVLKSNGKTHPPTRNELVKMSNDVSAVLKREMLKNIYFHNQFSTKGDSGNIISLCHCI